MFTMVVSILAENVSQTNKVLMLVAIHKTLHILKPTNILKEWAVVKKLYLLERCWLDHVDKVGQYSGRVCDVRQTVHLQVGGERVGKTHVAGECAQYQVSHLNAIGWNDITERIVVVTQEFWEIVQQNKQHSKRSLETKKEMLNTENTL